MNALQRIAVILGYEWRRALAKKWVLVLIVLSLTFETLPFIVFSQTSGTLLTAEIKKTMWVVGVLIGQSVFVHLIAIMVGGGSMSEEYEQGTADVLLSKPITKVEYITGKFLGGFLLLSFVEVITTIAGVILAYGFFGVQRDIHFVPLIFVAVVYSMLLFFSLTFMFSEVLRRSTLAMMMSFGIFMVSQIVGTYLLFRPEQFYRDVSQLLPTWSATALPTSLAADLMLLPGVGLITTPIGNVASAAIIIAVYTVIFVLIAYVRFVKSDVTKKTG